MFYKLKVILLKNNLLRRVYHSLFKKSENNRPDIKDILISKYVKGKSFIDVGCMWGVNGYFSFLAEEKGAREVVAFDIYPASEEFLNVKKIKNSNVKYINGDINSKDSINRLGKFDIVYCTGLLYHVPDPLYTLSRLRDICNDVLILGTAIIPELGGISNAAVFYPYLNESQRKIWDLNQGTQLAISEPFNPKQGYGNWIWGMSASCLESMVLASGFKIIEKYHGKFYSFLVCNLSSEPFLSVSGDWSEPDDKRLVLKYNFKIDSN